MSEFSVTGAPPPLSFAARPAPAAKAPAIANVAKSDLGQSSNDPAGARPQPTKLVKSVAADPDAPTGPPPAFQASLLEVESNLQTMIKRMDAEREHSRELRASEEKQGKMAPPPLDKEVAAHTANGLSKLKDPTVLQAIHDRY